MFFASSALYPLWRVRESSVLLYEICRLNPFTYAVEATRFALYGRLEWNALAVVVVVTGVLLGLAFLAYNPSKGLMVRRGGPAATA
jgi:ABC-2 type transport system permease protein